MRGYVFTGKVELTRRSLIASLLAAVVASPAFAAPSWRYARPVTITADDIEWFRRARALWIDCEAGAPAIIPQGMDEDAYWNAFENPASDALQRMERVICAFFLHASFSPGRYTLSQPVKGLSSFEVTANHVRLLQTTSWRSSSIDCKRPYGDFTHFEIDMARALGLPITEGAEGYAEIGPENESKMVALHERMLFVLQCDVEHAAMEPGDWFIPFDGWEGIIHPRCVPVSDQKIKIYESAMAAIALRGIVESDYDLVVPKLKASSDLFSL